MQEIPENKVDPCAKCSHRVMANSAVCSKCGKWVHGRCVKMKKVTSILAKGFIWGDVLKQSKELSNQLKLTFHNQVELVKSFCYLGDRLNAGCGSKATVTIRTKIRWIN